MIDKIRCKTRIGNDIHKELIALLKAIQRGWIPPESITEDEYNAVRLHRENYPDHYVGLVGFCATFGNKWFGGYARGSKPDGSLRDIPNEAIRNLMKQAPLIKNIVLTASDYRDIDMGKFNNALVYCDPPYRGTTKYATEEFDYEYFYDWVKKQVLTIPF